MASPLKRRRPRLDRAFTLLEMVGALAVMAIVSAAIAPAALHSLNAAAVNSEATTVGGLGTDLTLYLKANGTLPTQANWATGLATYAGLGSTGVSTNPRGVTRILLTDPAASPAPRAIILSSMRANLALPTAAVVRTATEFDQIWQTADGSVPPTSSWAGWSAWNAVTSGGQYLVIGRVNLSAVYATDLQSYTLTLNNRGSAAASYNLVNMAGVAQPVVSIAAGATVVLTQFPRVQVNLYKLPAGATLGYSYVVSSTGKTFDFDGANWTPQ
ncbi:MAG TPA: type II secretion system protein [Opitutaceae bacterium]|jgi:prepilin-type N-terminal cleavage/methylation domain-containing protein